MLICIAGYVYGVSIRIFTVILIKTINEGYLVPGIDTMGQNSALTVITTHINADFDALASMLAAQKLYPDSLVVFPGSQEKNLRNFFIQSMVYLLNIANVKDIDFDEIKRLVLVDTRQPGRIGKFASILDRPGLEVHIYDHHPPTANDIQGTRVIQEQLGATVTILSEIIDKKKINLSPDEATIMCLGIYEDTGSFTFPSTTERDFRAAAFLLARRSSSPVVSHFGVPAYPPYALYELHG